MPTSKSGWQGNFANEPAKANADEVAKALLGIEPTVPAAQPKHVVFHGIKAAPIDPEELQDAEPEVKETQCLCCVAAGDTSIKTCTYRCETGTEEGWWCDWCYKDFKLNDQDSPSYL